MTIPQWILGCTALLVLAAGCSDSPSTAPPLHTRVDERGITVIDDQTPEGPISYGDARVRKLAPAQEAWLEDKNREFDRKHEALLAMQKEQEEEGRKKIEFHKKIMEHQMAGAYGDAMRNKNQMLQRQQESLGGASLLAERRRSRIQGLQEKSQSEMADQQKATGIYLKSEGVRQQQEAAQFGRPAPVPSQLPE